MMPFPLDPGSPSQHHSSLFCHSGFPRPHRYLNVGTLANLCVQLLSLEPWYSGKDPSSHVRTTRFRLKKLSLWFTVELIP
jgi:hypothetical protein